MHFEDIYNILAKCGIIPKFDENNTSQNSLENSLNQNPRPNYSGLLIPREQLLKQDLYDELSSTIDELRKKYSSSYLTSLQKTASTKQKWPLLNLVRQLLMVIGYKMTPIRKSNGYDKETKKKKYIRLYRIEKMIV